MVTIVVRQLQYIRWGPIPPSFFVVTIFPKSLLWHMPGRHVTTCLIFLSMAYMVLLFSTSSHR